MSQLTEDHIPLIGIIMLDTSFPRIVGDIGNPATFSFPVLYKVVDGATSRRVVIDADRLLLQPFIDAARQLEAMGVQGIVTSCGFLALFHRELNDAVGIPVYSSSLLQAHFVAGSIKKNQRIGILTAHSQSLTTKHFAGVGIETYPLSVVGLDDAEEFGSVFLGGKEELDVERCQQEMIAAADRLVSLHPDVGAIILECTNMVPFAAAVRERTNLPVFDVVTMINYVHASISRQKFQQDIDFSANSQK